MVRLVQFAPRALFPVAGATGCCTKICALARRVWAAVVSFFQRLFRGELFRPQRQNRPRNIRAAEFFEPQPRLAPLILVSVFIKNVYLAFPPILSFLHPPAPPLVGPAPGREDQVAPASPS